MEFSLAGLMDEVAPIFAFMTPMLGSAIGITLAIKLAFMLKSLFRSNRSDAEKS